MRRGFTLVELMVGMTIMGLLIVGAMTVFSSSMRSFYKTKTDINLTTDNSLGMQRVADSLKPAYSMLIENKGLSVTFTLPLVSAVLDPTTYEHEYVDPLQSDGVSHTFIVVDGQLIDKNDGRVLIDNIVLIDPEPKSSQYNQTYAPFQLTTIGSRRALTINFITQEEVLGEPRYVRMKTTVIIRNSI